MVLFLLAENSYRSFTNTLFVIEIIAFDHCICEKKVWKMQAFRDSNPDLCDTGAVL